jgi:hypothetical protein
MFYFTFRNPDVSFVGNPGSIHKEYIDKFTLAQLEIDLAKYRDGKLSANLVDSSPS